MGKYPKDRRGTPQRRTSFANDGLPPGPRYGGRVPVRMSKISSAQNLSDTLNSRRATGPWVCKNCRWCSSTSAPGFSQPTLPVQIPAGDPRASPTQTWTQYSHAVGAGPRPARRPPEPHLSPTRPKGALLEYPQLGRRRRPPTQSPAQRVCVGEEEQGSGRSFRRQAETETSGLCDDEPPWAK